MASTTNKLLSILLILCAGATIIEPFSLTAQLTAKNGDATSSDVDINDVMVGDGSSVPRTKAISNLLYENMVDSACQSTSDCTHMGVCVRQRADSPTGYCQCLAACYGRIPLKCPVRNNRLDRPASCTTLGPAVLEHTGGRDVICDPVNSICVCPSTTKEACHKADVRLTHAGEDTPYQGQSLTLSCCLTGHPRDLVVRKPGEKERVYWMLNSTIRLSPTSSPLTDDVRADDERSWFNRCWQLTIPHVQYRDSGTYTCTVQLYPEPRVLTKSIGVVVRAPVAVNITKLVALNSSAIAIEWTTSPTAGLPVNIRLFKSNDRQSALRQVLNVKDSLVLVQLQPATFYTVGLEIVKVKNNLTARARGHIQTKEAIPGHPYLIDMRMHDKRRTVCEVSWQPPADPHGRIRRYEVSIEGVLRSLAHLSSHGAAPTLDVHHPPTAGVDCANLTNIQPRQFMNCQFVALLPNRRYTARVVAVNAAGKSEPAVFDDVCVTDYGAPDVLPAPSFGDNLRQTIGPNDTFELFFDEKPDELNGPIACYYIAIVPLKASVTSLDALPPTSDVDVEWAASVYLIHTDRRTPPDAAPRDTFAYIAEAYTTLPDRTVIGDGRSSGDESTHCPVMYQSRYPADDTKILTRDTKYTGFLIVRIEPDETLTDDSEDRWKRSLKSPQPIHAFSDYFPLVEMERPASIDTRSSSWFNVILVLLVCMFILMLTTFGFVFFLQKKGLLKSCFEKNLVRDRNSFESLTKKNNKDYQAIPVDQLASEYILRHRDSDFLFTSEFEALPHYHFDTKASDLDVNATKNRYNDIKAFDSTRVTLKTRGGDPSTDYINANFIKGYKSKKVFIAAQGPLQQTEADFWRMVWEQRVQIVIMVTNLYEKYRHQCQKYWPDDTPTRYGVMEVAPIESTHFADYTVRTFSISNKECEDSYYETVPSLDQNGGGSVGRRSSGSPSSSPHSTMARGHSPTVLGETQLIEDRRQVTQYHYTGWSDYRAPECTTGLLRFLMRMRKLPAYNSHTPVVVHCSAGVGRTGTFVAIDGLLDQCLDEHRADVFGFVSELRRQRNFMVQSLEQYVFVYKALAEWHTFGDTDGDVDRFDEHSRRLLHPASTSGQNATTMQRSVSARSSLRSNGGKAIDGGVSHPLLPQVPNGKCPSVALSSGAAASTGLEAEFMMLDLTLEETRSCDFGCKEEHSAKNRQKDCVPFDRNRVILMPIVGHGDNSYINASVVKGYFYPYILAQDPVGPDTCYDFWRMVCEQGSGCIVTLSQPQEFCSPPEEKFWCDERCVRRVFGASPAEISVELLPDDDDEDAARTHHRTPSPAVFVRRRMLVKNAKENDSRQVVQFHFVDWPPSTSSSPTTTAAPSSSSCPNSTAGLLELIGRVLQRQSQTEHDTGPIIVHCRNGSTKSGLYCLVSLLLERLKAEGRVDVFQTAKNLRSQRPLVLNSVDQYMFAYQCIIDYLESFR